MLDNKVNKWLVLAIVLLAVTGIYFQMEGSFAEATPEAARELQRGPETKSVRTELPKQSGTVREALLQTVQQAPEQTLKQVAQQPLKVPQTHRTGGAGAAAAVQPVFPVEGGKVSSSTGWYYSEFYRDWRYHQGVDIQPGNTSQQAVVRSCVEGTVESVSRDEFFGTTVVVRASDDTEWKYSGLESSQVAKGQRVGRGSLLGRINGAPAAEPEYPHLHLEVIKSGQQLDPALILGSR